MQASDYVIAASLIVGLSGPALAQTPAPTVGQAETVENQWTVSGLIGTAFEDDPSINYGFQLGYQWARIFGAEFLAEFSPDFEMDNLFLAASPSVNAFMLNAIAAIPIGATGNFQPYVSGGFGGIKLKTDLFAEVEDFPEVNPLLDAADFSLDRTIQGSHTGFGGNIGFGAMSFGETVGFRADLRYYAAGDDPELLNDSPGDNFAEGLLSGLSFWRVNAGIAFRW
jgi:hypothetical protein